VLRDRLLVPRDAVRLVAREVRVCVNCAAAAARVLPSHHHRCQRIRRLTRGGPSPPRPSAWRPRRPPLFVGVEGMVAAVVSVSVCLCVKGRVD